MVPASDYRKVVGASRPAPSHSCYRAAVASPMKRTTMKTRINVALIPALAVMLVGAAYVWGQQRGARPQGPCDIYAAASAPCAAAHSTTRALYASYNGPLYQVLRQSDGKTLDIGVVPATASDAGGYANAAT